MGMHVVLLCPDLVVAFRENRAAIYLQGLLVIGIEIDENPTFASSVDDLLVMLISYDRERPCASSELDEVVFHFLKSFRWHGSLASQKIIISEKRIDLFNERVLSGEALLGEDVYHGNIMFLERILSFEKSINEVCVFATLRKVTCLQWDTQRFAAFDREDFRCFSSSQSSLDLETCAVAESNEIPGA